MVFFISSTFYDKNDFYFAITPTNFYMILYFTHQYLICMSTFVKLYYNVPIIIMFHYYFSIKKKYLMKLWHKKLFFCTDFPTRSFLCKNPYIKNNTNHTLLFTRIYYCMPLKVTNRTWNTLNTNHFYCISVYMNQHVVYENHVVAHQRCNISIICLTVSLCSGHVEHLFDSITM
jgi:hypothetical protein